MTCEVVLTLARGDLKKLNPDQFGAAADHLVACSSCRNYVLELLRRDGVAAKADEPIKVRIAE